MHAVLNIKSLFVTTFAIALVAFASLDASAQLVRAGGVGGVEINGEGVLANPAEVDTTKLHEIRQQGLAAVPQDLNKLSNLRFVSLRRLEAMLAKSHATGQPVPDEVQLMAGLQRVQYVLVYPELNDVVLAGPAEGWRVDAMGNIVGTTTGRPVITLDDFMAAFRSALDRPGAGMSCSIDPTPEGLARVQKLNARRTPNLGPQQAAANLAKALGQQKITVTGVPTTSHFARSMVAADFRMKRLAMGFEPAPIAGMPSYLQLLKGRGSKDMLPRWWLAPNYQPLLRDAKGLAWELRGQGVQCLTEQDHIDAAGKRTKSTKAGSSAQQWADRFTDRFEDLANHDSSFGQLRNAMDLAVVTTLLVHEGFAEQVGLDMPWIAEKQELARYNAPKSVATQTTFIKQRGRWVISASGGVQISPGEILANPETTPKLAAVAGQQTRLASDKSWWWDAK